MGYCRSSGTNSDTHVVLRYSGVPISLSQSTLVGQNYVGIMHIMQLNRLYTLTFGEGKLSVELRVLWLEYTVLSEWLRRPYGHSARA